MIIHGETQGLPARMRDNVGMSFLTISFNSVPEAQIIQLEKKTKDMLIGRKEKPLRITCLSLQKIQKNEQKKVTFKKISDYKMVVEYKNRQIYIKLKAGWQLCTPLLPALGDAEADGSL